MRRAPIVATRLASFAPAYKARRRSPGKSRFHSNPESKEEKELGQTHQHRSRRRECGCRLRRTRRRPDNGAIQTFSQYTQKVCANKRSRRLHLYDIMNEADRGQIYAAAPRRKHRLLYGQGRRAFGNLVKVLQVLRANAAIGN